MALLGDLLVRLGLDTSGFTRAVGDINKELAGLERETQRSFGGIKAAADRLQSVGAGLTAAVTLPIIGFGAAALKAAGDLDALKRGLVSVTGSAEAAERQFNELREVAKLPGLGFKEAVQGATNLQAIGFSAQKSKDILLQFGNALATVGRGREDLGEVIRQLGQLGARGVVTADNLRPIIERVPQVAAIIKREFGGEALSAPAERFKQLGISSQEFVDVLLRALGKLPRVTGGIKNDFENFSDTVQVALADVGKALIPFAQQMINVLVPAIQGAAAAFTSLSPGTQEFAIKAGLAAAAIGPLILGLGTLIKSVIELRTALGAVAVVFGTTRLALLGWAGVIAGAAVSVYQLWAALIDLQKAQNGARDAAKTQEDGLQRLHSHLISHKNATREQTAELWRLYEAFHSGNLTQQDYLKSVQAIAIEIGKTVPAIRTAGEEQGKYRTEIALTAKEQKKFAESATSAADLASKAPLEYIKSLKRTQDAAQKEFDDFYRELAGVIGKYWDEQQDRTTAYFKAVIKAQDEVRRKLAREPIEVKWVFNEEQMRAAMDVISMQQAQRRAAENIKEANAQISVAVKNSAKEQKKALQEVSTILNDMTRDIARSIINWKGFGDVAKTTLKSIGEAILRNVIQHLLETTKIIPTILKGLDSLLSKIPGLGGLFGGLGKGAGAAGTIGDAAGAAGSAAGSVGSAVSGIAGALNPIGAIASVGSLVSGIFGNFQNARQETSLNAIESNTRDTETICTFIWEYVRDYFQHIRDGRFELQKIAILMTELNDSITWSIKDNIAAMTASVQRLQLTGSPATAGAGITNNISIHGGIMFAPGGESQFVDWFVSQLRSRGVKI